MLKGYLDLVKDWLREMGFTALLENEAWQVDSIILLLGIGLLGSLATGVYRAVLWWYRRRQQYRLQKDLHPFFSATDIRKATQHYVSTHFQSNPPSHHQELIQSHKVTARQKLIPFFLQHAFRGKADDQRFYMLLAGSGMGKTTFMVNLYVAYLKSKRLGRGTFHIRLMPLGYPDLIKRIEQIDDQENTILLLDGLDEDPQAIRNYKRRLERVLNKVKDFRCVVFTCRTQFFPSEEEEPRETGVLRFGTRQGFQTFAKLYLSPFDEQDIRQYLNHYYGFWNRKRKQQAHRIIQQTPNLVVRPMILSYIDDLVDSQKSYEHASELYATMIDKWIEREANRVREERREEFRQELFRFSREVALSIYKHRRRRNGLFIGLKEIKRLSDVHDIRLEDMEMQSRSLLNRNARDEFKFAHKSILEHFLAREAVEDPKFAAQLDFQSMDLARRFYDEMCLRRHTLPLFEEGKANIRYKTATHADWQEIATLGLEEVGQVLELWAEGLSSLAPIAPLKQLVSLHLHEVADRDLSALLGMQDLRNLQIHRSQVTQINSLAELLDLAILHLTHSPVQDFAPLRKLTQLRELDIQHTRLGNIEAIQHLTRLTRLNLSGTNVKDLSPLRSLTELETLSLAQTAVASIGQLRDVSHLTTVDLSHTRVENLNALRNLKHLQYLDLTASRVKNLTPLKGLKSLHTLRLDHSDVQQLAPLQAHRQLRYLSLINTPISDAEVLYKISGLTELTIDTQAAQQLDQQIFSQNNPQCNLQVVEVADALVGTGL